jgi:hypothetical protein
MTVDEVLQTVAARTTDHSGHIASFVFRQYGAVGHIEARLDKSGGASPNLWKIVWTVHWRSDRGQEQRDSSTDLKTILARFGRVDLRDSSAESLDDAI